MNGLDVLTATDSSSQLATTATGIGVWAHTGSLLDWVGGSLPIGNGAQSILNPAEHLGRITEFRRAAALNGLTSCDSIKLDNVTEQEICLETDARNSQLNRGERNLAAAKISEPHS